MTFVEPGLFIEEIKSWKLTKGAMYKVRIMKAGDFYFFKFHIPNTSEFIETAIQQDDYERFAISELSPVSVPATWERNEPAILEEIKKKLEDLNNAIATSNLGPRLQ
jgi:hypothetical protein